MRKRSDSMAIFYLENENFTDAEKLVVSHGDIRVYTFRYSTGTAGLKIENKRGYFTVLPFYGHQIWRASFDGIDLHMDTNLAEPTELEQFLDSYGCFVMHSGLCGVGGPGPEDSHKPHGDLPVAAFRHPRIECGEDEGGRYVRVLATFHKYRTYSDNYKFTSGYKLYENGAVITSSVKIENLRKRPMEYVYLCHINFMPFEGAKLIGTLPLDKEHIEVLKVIPASMPEEEAKKLSDYMDKMQENPEVHVVVDKKSQMYDPEIVAKLTYLADEEGYAHTLQKRTDGYACYVKHPVEPLNNSLRWISRTDDEEAMGMVLPASAINKGYTYAKKNGMVRTIEGESTLEFSMDFGLLVPAETEEMCKKIEKVLAK